MACTYGIQVQPRCCDESPVASDCNVMLTELIATYYRVDITGVSGAGGSFGFCETDGCPPFNGSYVFGPVPSATGGSDAEDDAVCCVELAYGPYCEWAADTFAYDRVFLCFKRLTGGTHYETSVVFEDGCGSNQLGFYKITAVPQNPLAFNNEPLPTTVNDSCCTISDGTAVITAIPPP